MTDTFTAYSSKSTAMRGFDRQFPGIDPTPYIYEVEGKWGFYPDQVDTTGEVQAMAAELAEADMPSDLAAPEHQVDAPADDTPADSPALVEEGTPHVGTTIPAPPADVTSDTAVIEVPADTPAAEAEAAPKLPSESPLYNPALRVHSQIVKPVDFCNALFDRMAAEADGKQRRSECVKAAIAAGVGPNTARSQYQKWFRAQRAATSDDTPAG